MYMCTYIYILWKWKNHIQRGQILPIASLTFPGSALEKKFPSPIDYQYEKRQRESLLLVRYFTDRSMAIALGQNHGTLTAKPYALYVLCVNFF